jgi:hypothetical protein
LFSPPARVPSRVCWPGHVGSKRRFIEPKYKLKVIRDVTQI